MDRQKVLVYVAAILTAVREVGDWSPLSPIMLALNMPCDTFMDLIHVMRESGLCTLTAEVIRLTPKGITLADKLNTIKA